MEKKETMIGSVLSVPVVFDTKNAKNFSVATHLVKVYIAYAGDNRNYSSISKEVFEKMIPSLYGSPVVGEYDKNTGDFKSHGEEIVLSDEGVEYRKNTHAYGYIDSQSEVRWVKGVENNNPNREYLTVDAYMWTDYFVEARKVLDGTNNQSMEIEILDGEYREDGFFEVTDARFLSLCILGEDVEPCFEGASIGKFELGKEFNEHRLKKFNEGEGKNMKEKENIKETFEEETISEQATSTNEEATEEIVEEEVAEEEVVENSETEENTEEAVETDEDNTLKELQEKVENLENTISKIEESFTATKEKNVELEAQLEEALNNYAILKEENEDLSNFKLQVEKANKEELVNETMDKFNILNLVEKEILSQEEFELLKENAINSMEIVELEKELSYILVKNTVLEEKPEQTFNLSQNNKEEKVTKNPYGDLVKYIGGNK